MHIPDGFVNAPTAVATGAASLGAVSISLRRASRNLGERTVPLLGVTAAFIFAAQMLNFPIAAGTSGHLLGAVLASVLIGPWSGVVVMAAVLTVQAVGMADGGITALGANIFNMAIAGGLGGYAVFRLLLSLFPRTTTSYFAAAAGAAWISVVAAAAAASLELAVSGTVPLGITLPAMVSVHMIIGLGEALITATVLAAVLASRPDLLATLPKGLLPGRRSASVAATSFGRRSRLLGFVVGALVVSVALAVLVSPFASSSPDGLERVAQEKGFADAAQAPVWRFSPLPDYQVPGISDPRFGTSLAGLLGVAALFAAVVLLGRAFGKWRPGTATSAPGHEHTDRTP